MALPEAASLLGARIEAGGVRFGVWSGAAERVMLCLFDEEDRETDRIEMARQPDDVFAGFVPGLAEGARYGLRADGPYDPANGSWFDPAKLLADPYALTVDRPYRYDKRLGASRKDAIDTASLMPKAIVTAPPLVQAAAPLIAPGGLIYELSVRGFSMRHPDIPAELRGTIAALAHPAVIAHLHSLGVEAVELMPIVAWMDERHLPPLGLANAWGYNPVGFMALDPRLVPGGWRQLAATVATLHENGIGVILDLVFNHTAESDAEGTTLSLRGLDNRAYLRHRPDAPGILVNDTGCGNTIACDHPVAERLILDALRTFVRHAGVDGFRFDLAPVLGRDAQGFDRHARLLRAIANDPEIGERMLIAEPWDVGPHGYQLGNFAPPFLEWNDRFRDDVRRFWRGDGGMAGRLATRLAGSSDLFAGDGDVRTRSINFLAAHDGRTLRDVVSYARKHNHANGEENRDGHGDEVAWNCGTEGETQDPALSARRRADLRAMLATLFLARGTILLTAGDEFGRTQQGNNNAYAQDNETTWLDWTGMDTDLAAFVGRLSGLRRRYGFLRDAEFLEPEQVEWLREDGSPMETADWDDPARQRLCMILDGQTRRLAVLVNGGEDEAFFRLPARAGREWKPEMSSGTLQPADGGMVLSPRSVGIAVEGY